VRRYQFLTADVFTTQPFGGNPLAVFPDARGLSDGEMQLLARELNLSESVFVFPPTDPKHVCRLRIFTPAMELPFAGHPTVGTALLLAWEGAIPLEQGAGEVVLEEAVGPVPVAIAARDGRAGTATLTSRAVELRDAPEVDLAALAGLQASELGIPGLPAQAASCGVRFLIVPVRDLEALGRVRMDRDRWEREIAGSWAPHVYFVAPATDADFRARMFAPAMGIEEDPATGAAAAAFAGYLRAHGGAGRWVIEQGVEMGRPSRLFVEADADGGIRVGGTAVPMMRGELLLPG
jgi:trans-2,3-dihydro-3-hydroxyanthranilate isomerase